MPRATFVIGVPRSGTTWLLALLAQHPEVVAVQQADLFESLEPLRAWWESTGGYGKRFVAGPDAGRAATAATYVGEQLRPEDFDRLCRPLVEHVLARLGEVRENTKVVVLQTPENVMHWPLIRRLIPDARFLHMIRDPRAVLASQRAAAKGWARGTFDADAESVAHLWRDTLDTAAELEQSGATYLEVRYETLRAGTAEELSRIFEWLELPANEKLLATAIENSSLQKMRRSDIGPENFVRTGLVEGWREELSTPQLRCMEYFLADRMRERGYEPVTPNSAKRPWRLVLRRAARRALQPVFRENSVLMRAARRLVSMLSGTRI